MEWSPQTPTEVVGKDKTEGASHAQGFKIISIILIKGRSPATAICNVIGVVVTTPPHAVIGDWSTGRSPTHSVPPNLPLRKGQKAVPGMD